MSIFLVNPNNSFIELYNGSIQIQYKDINYRIKKNTVNISNNKNNITSNLQKINKFENDTTDLIKKNIILDKKYTISNFSKNRSNNVEIFKIKLYTLFSPKVS